MNSQYIVIKLDYDNTIKFCSSLFSRPVDAFKFINDNFHGSERSRYRVIETFKCDENV